MSFCRNILHAGQPQRQPLHYFHGSIRAAVAITLVACRSATSGAPPVAPPPSAATPSAPVSRPTPLAPAGLPPVPVITGAALAPRLQYPADNQLIATRDSNFVLGSVGSG